jgi:hypothetical protein
MYKCDSITNECRSIRLKLQIRSRFTLILIIVEEPSVKTEMWKSSKNTVSLF